MLVLQSKRRLKFVANTTLLVLALLFSSLMLSWIVLPVFPHAIGKFWTSMHTRDFRDDASEAIASARSGDSQALADQLQDNFWHAIRKGDRAWPAKRKMLQALVRNAERSGDIQAMGNWAFYWRNLDDRDVDALAYWYGYLRHDPKQKIAAEQNLISAMVHFPNNFELLRFNLLVMREADNPRQSERLQQRLNALVTRNWRLEWRRKSRDVGGWHLGRGFSRLLQFDFADAATEFGDAFDLVSNSKRHRRLKRTNGELGFSVDLQSSSCCRVEFSLPTVSSTINLYPPAVPGIAITEIRVNVGDTSYQVEPDSVEARFMYRQKHWFHSTGDHESHLRISVMDALGNQPEGKLPATIEFRVQIDNDLSPQSGQNAS